MYMGGSIDEPAALRSMPQARSVPLLHLSFSLQQKMHMPIADGLQRSDNTQTRHSATHA